MLDKIQSWTVDRSVMEAETAERLRQAHEEQVASVRRRQLAFDAAQQASADHRRQVELEASNAKRDAAQSMAEGAQRAQWAWATRRNELRDQVAAMRRDIQGCEERMDHAPLAEAAVAASEREVLARRLTTLEGDYAIHLKASPA